MPSQVKSRLKKTVRALVIAVVLLYGWALLTSLLGPKYIAYVRNLQEARYLKEYRKYLDILKADTYGGKTPEETFDLFLYALKKGDTELASKYYVLEKQKAALDDFRIELQKEGNLNKSAAYFTDVKTKGVKVCHDLDNPEKAGCNFEYEYTTTEDQTVQLGNTKDKLFIPRGSERVKITDLKLNQYTKIWKIVQP